MSGIEQDFIDFAQVFALLELVGLGFLIAILIETAWDIYSKRRPGYGESLANFLIATGNHLLERTAFGLVFIIGLYVAQNGAIFTIPSTWWSWVLALLIADLTYYWMHRFEHEVRVLWAYHSVHHSSPEFNLSTGLRLAWIEGAIEWVFFVPMILLGFSAVQTLVAISIVVLYQTWIHTEKIGKLGWVDDVFNTPSLHRVHHGSNKQYHDKNYGGILIVWDRLFGTYQRENEKVVYGITTPLNTWNPVTINFYEFCQIGKDAWGADTMGNKLKVLFGPPGWKPNHRSDV